MLKTLLQLCEKQEGVDGGYLEETHLGYELPFKNFTFGDDQDRPKATVHFPWGSTQAVADTAAQSVSPGEEDMHGPELKFSRSNCPSLRDKGTKLITASRLQHEKLCIQTE